MGTVEYEAAWQLQRELAAARAGGEIGDMLLLLEHPPTITLGRGAAQAHVLATPEGLAEAGVRSVAIDRGGDVTYHGPGQLVGYPILDLSSRGRDLHAYLRDLEEGLIRAVSRLGIEGRRFPPHTGVWVGDEKVAAIGIKVTRWVTTHGFALNVAPDMAHFDLIVPCGIRGYGVTSLARLLGRDLRVQDAIAAVLGGLAEVFGPVAPLRSPTPDSLSPVSRRIMDSALDAGSDRCYTSHPSPGGAD